MLRTTIKRRWLSAPVWMAVVLLTCMTGYVLRAHNLVMAASPAAAGDAGLASPGARRAPDPVAMPVQEIAALNLFGRVRPATVVNPDRFRQVPKTKLDLTLNAVFANTEPSLASAVIATDNNNSRASRYQVGDGLPGEAVLYAIHPEYVVMKRGGRLEKLVFPRDRREGAQGDGTD